MLEGLGIAGFVMTLIFIIFGVIILGFILWIYALVDVLSSGMKPEEKLIWVIILILLSVLGALVYLIVRSTGGVKMAKKSKKLYRSKNDRMLAGVCGGLAEYFQIDASLVRLLWVLITIFTSIVPGIIVYVVAAIIIPEK